MNQYQNELNQLLGQYLQGTATKQDRYRLYELVLSGRFDNLVGGHIHESLKNEFNIPISAPDTARMDSLYESRIKGRITPLESEIENSGKKIYLRKWWWAAASVSAVLIGIRFWNDQMPSAAQHLPAETTTGIITQETVDSISRFVDKQLVYLPDRSTVLLNDGATLSYNATTFGNGTREVELTGEAFFDIKPVKGKVFVVNSGDIKTTVLGTAFNIRSVPGQNEVQVTVARGKVQVGNRAKTYDLLTADQQLTINTATNSYFKKEIPAKAATEWQNNFLILDDVTMEAAAEQIHRKFGVPVFFKNKELTECTVTASFLNNEELDHVLQVISTIHGFDYSYHQNGEYVVIDGDKSCN